MLNNGGMIQAQQMVYQQPQPAQIQRQKQIQMLQLQNQIGLSSAQNSNHHIQNREIIKSQPHYSLSNHNEATKSSENGKNGQMIQRQSNTLHNEERARQIIQVKEEQNFLNGVEIASQSNISNQKKHVAQSQGRESKSSHLQNQMKDPFHNQQKIQQASQSREETSKSKKKFYDTGSKDVSREQDGQYKLARQAFYEQKKNDKSNIFDEDQDAQELIRASQQMVEKKQKIMRQNQPQMKKAQDQIDQKNQGGAIIFESDFYNRYNSNQEQKFNNFFDAIDQEEREEAFIAEAENFNQIDFFGNHGGEFGQEGGIEEMENDFLGNLSDHFGSQMMIVGGDDLNKIHQNFAGDTFSQISSTYEQQHQYMNNKGSVKHSSLTNNMGLASVLHGHQQSQPRDPADITRPESAPQHSSKLHFYQEKNRPNTKVKMHHHNNDELLDSMILNNLNDNEINSQRDNQNILGGRGANNHQLNSGDFYVQNNQYPTRSHQMMHQNNNIYEFKSQKQQSNSNSNYQNPHLSSKVGQNGQQQQRHQSQKRILAAYPSSHSNLHLNQIIMNSEQLQQSEDVQSTMTIYNSGVFDDASIMRILDKSVSDDSLFLLQQQQIFEDLNLHHQSQQQMNAFKNQNEVEQNFNFECEDVKQILTNINSKFKEKLQKQRQMNNTSSNQLVGINFEELKSFEILVSSAVEKVRIIQAMGKVLADSERTRAISLRKQREKLKVQVHGQVRKFKELCKRQYRQTENWKFKYQINEYETGEKIQQLEERLDRQSDEINKLANKCEQLRYEKDTIAKRNDKKLKDVDKLVKGVILNLGKQDQTDSKNKVNNSFCVGAADRSLLIQPISKKRIHNNLVKMQSNADMNNLQQSVDDKENESILSNQAQKINSRDIKTYLIKVQSIVKQQRQYNKNHLKKLQHNQMQEVGSCYQSSQMFPGGPYDLENQQSQFIPDREDEETNQQEYDMNKAFINKGEGNSESGSLEDSEEESYKPCDRMIDITEESIDYEFDQKQMIVMDGKNSKQSSLQLSNQLDIAIELGQGMNSEGQPELTEDSKQSLRNLLDIKDKISPQDLKGQGNRNFGQSPSDREQIIFEREKMLKNSGLQRINDLRNSNKQDLMFQRSSFNNQQKLLPQNQQWQNDGNNMLLNFSNDNSLDAEIEMLGNIKEHLEQKPQGLNNEINFSQEFSGFLMNEEFKKTQEDPLNGTGKNILVFDDFNGEPILGSAGGQSRNKGIGGNLYSGGSSQLSMIHAFPSSNRIQVDSNDVILVKVMDRKIPIPRLNMHAIHRREKIEMFSKNLPDVNQTESSLSQSEIQPTLQSNQRNTTNQPTDPQNITSFQNESISKQYQSSHIDHTHNSSAFANKNAGQNQLLITETDQDDHAALNGFMFDQQELGFGDEMQKTISNKNLLDQAVFYNESSQNSKSNLTLSKKSNNQRNSANGKSNHHSQFGGASSSNMIAQNQNMFDSFKQELDMLDELKKGDGLSIENKQAKNQKSMKKPENLLLSLQQDDESLERENFQDVILSEIGNPQNGLKNNGFDLEIHDKSMEDKSADLSANVSKFKRSLSDPNLMFNDVDSDKECHLREAADKVNFEERKTLAKNNGNDLIPPKATSHKLNTPQGGNLKSGKFKFPISMIQRQPTQIVAEQQATVSSQQSSNVSSSTIQNQQAAKLIKISGPRTAANLQKQIPNSNERGIQNSQGQFVSEGDASSQAKEKEASVNARAPGIIQSSQQVRKSLGQFQANLRKSIGNQRNSQDDQSSQVNPSQLGQRDSFEIAATAQSMDHKNPSFLSSQSSNIKVKLSSNKGIIRASSENSNQTSDNGESADNQDSGLPFKKSQLIKNYMKGAATMNGDEGSSQAKQISKSSISKLFNPKRTSFQRNSAQSMNHSNQEEMKSEASGSNAADSQKLLQNIILRQQAKLISDPNLEDDVQLEKKVPLKNMRDSQIMLEMKEHLQSQELGGLDKNFLRRKKSSLSGEEAKKEAESNNQGQILIPGWEGCESALTNNDDSKLMELSPDAKRQSQSHTPKKRDVILVNNQSIKLGQKIKILKAGSNNNVNISQIDNTVDLGNGANESSNLSLVRQSLPLKKITLQRNIIKKKAQQNISAIDNSIDQSQLLLQRIGDQNETFVAGGGNGVDNSILINDISVIQPAMGGGMASKGSNIIKGLRMKSQITKVNPGNILNISNLNTSSIVGGPTNHSLLNINNNNSQLNLSILNQSSVSKAGHNQSIANYSSNGSAAQPKSISLALGNGPFLNNQQIIDKIKKQQKDAQQVVPGQSVSNAGTQVPSTVQLSYYHSNPNPSSAAVNESQISQISGVRGLSRGDANSQSKDKLLKIPQRMVVNPGGLTKLGSGQKQLLNFSKGQINQSSIINTSAINETSFITQAGAENQTSSGVQARAQNASSAAAQNASIIKMKQFISNHSNQSPVPSSNQTYSLEVGAKKLQQNKRRELAASANQSAL